ncbi:hypothetical protein H2201_009436, partial [Coniosporium apollinis]
LAHPTDEPLSPRLSRPAGRHRRCHQHRDPWRRPREHPDRRQDGRRQEHADQCGVPRRTGQDRRGQT